PGRSSTATSGTCCRSATSPSCHRSSPRRSGWSPPRQPRPACCPSSRRTPVSQRWRRASAGRSARRRPRSSRSPPATSQPCASTWRRSSRCTPTVEVSWASPRAGPSSDAGAGAWSPNDCSSDLRLQAFAHALAEVLSVPALLVREGIAPEEDLVLDPEAIEELRERFRAHLGVGGEGSGVALLPRFLLVAELEAGRILRHDHRLPVRSRIEQPESAGLGVGQEVDEPALAEANDGVGKPDVTVR